MTRLVLLLLLALAAALVVAVLLGESAFTAAQFGQAFGDPSSGPAEVLWQVRAPRAATALMVGAALGLAGAVMQGLLRNPLADPGVLGVSATAALGAASAIVLGAAAQPGAVETAALVGAGLAGLLLVLFSARVRSPEALILFGVALSSFAGAATALIFNLSPSPIATAEVMSWLLGSVQNRSWIDVLWVTPAVMASAGLAALAAPGLRMLSLGEETARTSGLPMARLRLLALLAAALATGAAVAVAGVIGFVGLERSAAPAENRRQALRCEGHADGLRDHGHPAHPVRQEAGSCVVRRQSWPERCGRCHLFRNHRGVRWKARSSASARLR